MQQLLDDLPDEMTIKRKQMFVFFFE